MIISKIANTQNGNMYVGVLNNKTSKVSFGDNASGWDRDYTADDAYDNGYKAGAASQQPRIAELEEEKAGLGRVIEGFKADFARVQEALREGIDLQKLATLLREREEFKTRAESAEGTAKTLAVQLSGLKTQIGEIATRFGEELTKLAK